MHISIERLAPPYRHGVVYSVIIHCRRGLDVA